MVTPDRRACTSTSGLKLDGASNPWPAAVIYLLALVVSAGRSVPLRLFETLCQTSEGGRPQLADGAAFKLDVIRDLTNAAARLSVQRKAGEHTPFVSRYDIADEGPYLNVGQPHGTNRPARMRLAHEPLGGLIEAAEPRHDRPTRIPKCAFTNRSIGARRLPNTI